MRNYDSSKNQEIKQKFVSREVIYCASQMISELCNSEEFGDSTYEEFYSEINWHQMAENMLYDLSDEGKLALLYELDVAEEGLDNIDPNLIIDTIINLGYAYEPDYIFYEPYEFWIISDFLGEKLKELEEIVVNDFLGFTIWGRCTTGQAIKLDSCISKVCEDMEILEGQAYEWN